MLEKLQKFFKENSDYRFFLKYDGQRTSEKYTAMIVDIKQPDLTVFKDTEHIEETFRLLLSMRSVNVNALEANLLIKLFENMKSTLIEQYSEKIVFAFAVELKSQIEFYTYLSNEDWVKDFISNDFKSILDFLMISIDSN